MNKGKGVVYHERDFLIHRLIYVGGTGPNASETMSVLVNFTYAFSKLVSAQYICSSSEFIHHVQRFGVSDLYSGADRGGLLRTVRLHVRLSSNRHCLFQLHQENMSVQYIPPLNPTFI